eukprot:Tbor_TRINITY_DN5317_c3_g1::TRINITY_DN5317_c3_g1_i10::g.4569::m.4569/K10082/LMAN2, VIP36; lectin, mannose-binding 2
MKQQMIVKFTFAYIALALLANAKENDVSSDIGGPITMHHSFIPPFVTDWWEEGVPHWRFGGDTVVTNKFVRVVPDKQSRFGWAFNVHPNEYIDWELRVTFFIRNLGDIVADGLGIWLISNPPSPDDKYMAVGPLHGMRNDFRGIGVVLDPYDNGGTKGHPIASLLTNMDGANRHWDTMNDLKGTSAARCSFNYMSSKTIASEIFLRYWKKKLTFTLYSPSDDLRKECGEVQEIHFPMNTSFYFGITATTGQVSGNHDITAFELRPLGKPISEPSIPLKHFDHKADEKDKIGSKTEKITEENDHYDHHFEHHP